MAEFNRSIDAYLGRYPNLKSRSISITVTDVEKLLITSDSGVCRSRVVESLFSFQLFLERNGRTAELYRWVGGNGCFFDLFPSPEALHETVDRLVRELSERADAVHPDAGTFECVIGPEVTGILAHEAFGHTVEADNVLLGTVAADRIGSQVADPRISLVDFAHTAFCQPCPAPMHFDDEGTLAVDAVIVDQGILKRFLHSRSTALHFGDTPLGHAKAWLFSDEPIIRMRNTAILPGNDALDDMISSIDNGYYLVHPAGEQADSTGQFSFGIRQGTASRRGGWGVL